METVLSMKDSRVPFAFDCFDAIHYKLLKINVNDIDELIEEICTCRFNNSLRNNNELGSGVATTFLCG